MFCLQGARALARSGRRLAGRIGAKGNAVCNRSRAVGRRVCQISRTLARRTGEAREQVIALNAEAGRLLRRSAKEARLLAAAARRNARGPGAQAKLRAASTIEQLAERCERSQSRPPSACAARRSDRVVSLADPDARPIRNGKAGKPNEFGYVAQVCEVTPNTKPGARGFVLPAASGAGNLGENTLLPETAAELQVLGLAPREVVLDGGFGHRRSEQQLAVLESERVFAEDLGRSSRRSCDLHMDWGSSQVSWSTGSIRATELNRCIEGEISPPRSSSACF